MSYVASFTGFRPSPRSDGLPWTQVQIEESASVNGPFLVIDVIDLVPIDSDPADPQVRSFTTESAALFDGWYRISFLDATGDAELLAPVYRGEDDVLPWRPTVADISVLLRARTVVDGEIVGEFNDETEPTAAQVDTYIDLSTGDIASRVETDIPASQYGQAKHLSAIHAARLIEIAYRPEQTESTAAYDALTSIFNPAMPQFIENCRTPYAPYLGAASID